MPLLDVLDETKRWAEEWLFPLIEASAPGRDVYRGYPPVAVAVAHQQGLEDATGHSTSREVIDTLLSNA